MPSFSPKLIVRSPYVDELDRFAQLAEQCAEAGITHLTLTETERSLWEIDDLTDPYLHWSVVHSALFKIVPPPILAGWVPEDFARRAQKLVSQKAKILKKTGLKGTAFFYDPMWWPDEVFGRHPHLRGPRVDHPRRSRHPRFAPCTDQREVLEMYGDSFERLYSISEGTLDTVIIRTNDSGTGFCWSDLLYNSPNGPDHCHGIGFAKRIQRFIDSAQEGVRRAGGDTAVYVGGAVSEKERAMFLASADEKRGYYAHSGDLSVVGNNVIPGRPDDFWFFPVRGVANPAGILERMSEAYEKGHRNMIFFTLPTMYGSDWEGDPLIIRIMGLFLKRPCSSFLSKIELLKALATEHYGRESVDQLVSAWMDIYHSCGVLKKYNSGGHMIFLGSLAQRWITRPLVVLPEELSAEERSHYVPYLFQINEAHEDYDLLDWQGTRIFDGMRHLRLFNKDMDSAMSGFNRALVVLDVIAGKNREQAEKLRGIIAGLTTLHCFLKNIRNCVNFQIILEDLKRNVGDVTSGCDSSLVSNQRAQLYTLLRSEIDNSYHLANLLESTHCEQIMISSTREGETPFMLGPDIVRHLKRKAEIMTEHWLDLDKLVSPPNR